MNPIAIIGGGIAGACLALDLARRGQTSVIFEARDALLSEASLWNEGKLHLGYVYARDRSLETTRRMLEGSLHFLPKLEALLERPVPEDWVSDRFSYGVPSSSNLSDDAIGQHFRAVDEAISDREPAFSKAMGRFIEARTARRMDKAASFPGISSLWETPEIALHTEAVAEALRARIVDDPLITVAMGHAVDEIVKTAYGHQVCFETGQSPETFKTVINASWRSLYTLRAGEQEASEGQWLYRYKHAIRASSQGINARSLTLVHGEFGDLVHFPGQDEIYLSWYPVCRTFAGTSPAYEPPSDSVEQALLRDATLEALSAFEPSLLNLMGSSCSRVGGGWILAHGQSDISDPGSGLHARTQIGLTWDESYLALNTGKYCLATLLAEQAADTILDQS